MSNMSLTTTLIILFLVVGVSIIYFSSTILTLISSVLIAFGAYIIGHWFWRWLNSPKIKILVAEESPTSGVKQPQTLNKCLLPKTNNQKRAEGSTTQLINIYPDEKALLNLAKLSGSAWTDCKEIRIYVLEVLNEGLNAAKNSLLYFNIQNINRICKWNSVPEPTIGGSQHFYDMYHRLTLLQQLSDRVAFVFRIEDDPPHILRQYDLSLLYGSKDKSFDDFRAESNAIDCRNGAVGELAFYSEDYQGKCKIILSYSSKDNSISIKLDEISYWQRGGFRKISGGEGKINIL